MGETVRRADLLLGQTYTAPSRPYPRQFHISNRWFIVRPFIHFLMLQ